jgi:hypothetical protein
MTVDLLADALSAFGAVCTDAAPPTEARSGAGVYQVRTPDGGLGYLKVTPVALGREAIARAERELRCTAHGGRRSATGSRPGSAGPPRTSRS